MDVGGLYGEYNLDLEILDLVTTSDLLATYFFKDHFFNLLHSTVIQIERNATEFVWDLR